MISNNKEPAVIFVPGIILPVMLSYAQILSVLKNEIIPYPKELEVYRGDVPPLNYTLNTEVEGIKRTADEAGLKTFHLVGYSGGGASSLAFAAAYPQRLDSLALIEPAWIGNQDMDEQDKADWNEIDEILAMPNEIRMKTFQGWQMKKGIEPPAQPKQEGQPPEWMKKRPAGIEAIALAFKSYNLNREQFREFDKPVYCALGSLSREIYQRMTNTLNTLFPLFESEVYEGRSHLDPPHRAEPERFAKTLRNLWNK